MEKKRKWERDYEKYSNSKELDERIEYLQDLINGKVATKEEYDEHKKLTAIKANLPKVKNILELRGKLEEERNEINQEIARRELIGKYNKAIEILEDGMKKLEAEKTQIEQEMKANPDKKEELQIKLAENEKKRQENNVKFGNAHERLKEESKNAEQSKFKDVELKDLKNEAISKSSNISQCNLACNKLMKGYSWQSIEVALDKFKDEKLTAKGPQAKKMEQNRTAAKSANAKVQQQKNVQPEKTESEPEKQEKQPKVETKSQESQEENAIANLTMGQKVKNWFKNLWAKIKEDFGEEEEIEQEEQQEQEESGENQKNEEKTTIWQKIKNWFKGDESNVQSENQPSNPEKDEGEKQPSKEEQPAKKEDSFRQYLREVAEKGIDGVEQEKADAEKAEKEAKRAAARQKLEANRAAAMRKEAERENQDR